ncbi:MAG TPA: hypothetical protein VMT87_10740 [Vicinamibacteria bacterium]|nr:hypothetical protein [Vicinamibacteria bacterium]
MTAARPCLAGALAVALFLGSPGGARAGDITVFATFPSPAENWNRGYGAALSSTWFRVLTFEGEAARVPGETPDVGMTSFTASALLAPPIGGLIPYGGLGVGLFRQTLGSEADTGTLRALVLGVKLRIQDLLVLKAEYRRLELSGDPLLAMDTRVSFGAGIAF